MADQPAGQSETKHWYQRIGPGLITACVVIGPGSIMTSSKVGASAGYANIWVIVIAVFFMQVYMVLGVKLGVVASSAPGNLVAERAGRWLAVLIGAGVFFISAAFQFGNNRGVHAAFESMIFPQIAQNGEESIAKIVMDYGVVIGFNAAAILFLFAFRNLYRAVERLMMVFVAIMLLSFAVNLLFAKPDFAELARGFVPPFGQLLQGDSLALLGLVGTTFVITAAYYQAYLVRQKGWGKDEMSDGLLDARIGSFIMFLITLMIMSTAAAMLRGQTLGSPADVADGLKPLFGNLGKPIFCLGLFSAAYSSFLVNSMIGGFIFADGLGLGSRPSDLAPRLFTAAVLLTGMIVALITIRTGWDAVPAIVAAQAVTVLAAPLLAGALLWMTNREDIMGKDRNRKPTNALAGVGFVLLLGMAGYLALVTIPNKIKEMRKTSDPPPAAAEKPET